MTPGKAVAFLLLGVLNTYLGLWLLGYAAYWFLYVIDATAEGRNDVKIPWPDEAFRERLWKLGHLAFLSLVWLLPVFAVFRYTELPINAELRPLLMLFISGTVLWLMLPISLLSSMTSASHWEIFRWTVLRRLMERFSIWMTFYLYTFPLLLGCSLVAYLALFGWEELKAAAEASSLTWLSEAVEIWSWVFVLPLTAVSASMTVLIYGRLLGRLAWMMDFWDEEDEENPVPEPPPPSARLRADHDVLEPVEQAVSTAPGLIPFAPDTEPEVALRVQQTLKPRSPAPPVAPPEQPRGPRRLWVRGIYRFPWYPASLKAWLFLSVGGFIVGAFIRWQLQFRN